MHRPVIARLAHHGSLTLAELPPAYLAPSLHLSMSSATQTSTFSTTPVAAGRGRDLNRNRGVSAIHRTGPKFKMIPIAQARVAREDAATRQNPQPRALGLFPPSREALSVPEFDIDFGRPWAIQELREKSWDDLHKLWWVCVKERNRIATSNIERTRLKAGFGDHEAEEREKVIRVTQNSIKHVLRERWYAWEDAQRLYQQGYLPEKMRTKEEERFSSGKPEGEPSESVQQ
ncbi:54S ribosomal protein L4 [Penicillium capsulatum]|uniref:Large ribosomal subunit protein uL29m n=1 Tax=Penicillium capsulatum TaxID=69766 RepID=A0A9W9LRS2_9EURO|nr:54S ribosomal protein L4 [Penicillium capsulatum]